MHGLTLLYDRRFTAKATKTTLPDSINELTLNDLGMNRLHLHCLRLDACFTFKFDCL